MKTEIKYTPTKQVEELLNIPVATSNNIDSINTKLEELAKYDVYKGDNGDELSIVLLELGNGSGEDSKLNVIGESIYKTIIEGHSNYDVVTIHENLKKQSYAWWCIDGDKNKPVFPATSFIFIDHTAITKNVSTSYEDLSCVLTPIKIDDSLEVTYSKSSIIPKFWYNKDALNGQGGWCWEINGVKTNIVAGLANDDKKRSTKLFLVKWGTVRRPQLNDAKEYIKDKDGKIELFESEKQWLYFNKYTYPVDNKVSLDWVTYSELGSDNKPQTNDIGYILSSTTDESTEKEVCHLSVGICDISTINNKVIDNWTSSYLDSSDNSFLITYDEAYMKYIWNALFSSTPIFSTIGIGDQTKSEAYHTISYNNETKVLSLESTEKEPKLVAKGYHISTYSADMNRIDVSNIEPNSDTLKIGSNIEINTENTHTTKELIIDERLTLPSTSVDIYAPSGIRIEGTKSNILADPITTVSSIDNLIVKENTIKTLSFNYINKVDVINYTDKVGSIEVSNKFILFANTNTSGSLSSLGNIYNLSENDIVQLGRYLCVKADISLTPSHKLNNGVYGHLSYRNTLNNNLSICLMYTYADSIYHASKAILKYTRLSEVLNTNISFRCMINTEINGDDGISNASLYMLFNIEDICRLSNNFTVNREATIILQGLALRIFNKSDKSLENIFGTLYIPQLSDNSDGSIDYVVKSMFLIKDESSVFNIGLTENNLANFCDLYLGDSTEQTTLSSSGSIYTYTLNPEYDIETNKPIYIRDRNGLNKIYIDKGGDLKVGKFYIEAAKKLDNYDNWTWK